MNAKQLETYRDQVLLVLNDYRDSERTLREEGTRLEISKRIVANAKLVTDGNAKDLRDARKDIETLKNLLGAVVEGMDVHTNAMWMKKAKAILGIEK